MARLVDSFIFNDEIDILKFRLESYEDVVDFTVIAESQYSFSGKPKPLEAREYLQSISYSLEKIIFVNYAPSKELIQNSVNNRWALERFARQSISDSFRNFSPETLLLISDVDELPSPEQIEIALKTKTVQSLLTPLYHRKANWLSLQGKEWATAKLGPISAFEDLNSVRYAKFPVIKEYPGMHLSYMSTSGTDIQSKAENSAHSEHSLNPDFMESVVWWADEYQLEHLPRFNRKHQGRLLVKKESELSNFQKEFLQRSPKFFDFNQTDHSYLERTKASFLLQQAWDSHISIAQKTTRVNLFKLVSALVKSFVNRQKRKIKLRARLIWGDNWLWKR